jgi:outer membrane protein OmpA-like peptidoglycan-associated protein
MSFFKENIVWIAPTAAIVLVATGFLDRDNGFSLFSKDQPQTETTDQQFEQQRLADFNASVVAALASPATGKPAPQVSSGAELETGNEASLEVTRNAPLDLLQVAPTQAPQVALASQAAPFDSDSAADFFASAQANLAVANNCEQDLGDLAASARIYFPTGGLSAEEAGLSAARLLGMVLKDCPGYGVQVEGHSDPSGDSRANQVLSKQRAEAVINRLAASGIDTAGFAAVGFGDTRPSGVKGEKSAAYYDRRVEFSIVQSAQKASVNFSAKPWQEPAAADCVAQLATKAALARQYYAPGSIIAPAGEMGAVIELATEVAQCDGAWLRIVGQHSDRAGSRENVSTGRLRALAMRNALLSAGYTQGRILVGAPSYAVNVDGEPGLPQSRVDFQVVSD